ncbi:hypothetical protein D3C87_1859830 [compost metagenome]
MKSMIVLLATVASAFATNDLTVCDNQIRVYMESEHGSLDVVGPVAVLARTEKMTIQRVIVDDFG